MSKNRQYPDPTPEEIEYLREHAHNTTAVELGNQLKRGAPTIYAWLKQLSITPYKTPGNGKDRTHPFRRQNRKMEKQILHNNIIKNPKNQMP